MQYKKTILNNGLRLITYAMPNMESASLGLWVRVGGRYEAREIKGISHFLEHLAFKGSKNYSCRQIKESIEGVGGVINGFTSEESTCYYVKLPAARQLLALDILVDMAVSPQLNQSDIEKERFVILEEIKMYKDLPQSHVQDMLDRLLWPEHPLGLPIIGQRDTISKIKREDLVFFQKRCYTPSNMVVAACGKLKHEELLRELKKASGKLETDIKNIFIPAPSYEQKPRIKILKKKTAQIHLALGFYGLYRDHPDKHIYSLLHVILGANMSSRLFNEVREKRGLAYQIGTQVKGFTDTGIFLIHAGVDNNKLIKAIEVIVRELDKIKKGSITKAELVRAKEYYTGQIRLGLEDTLDHMFWIGEPTLHLNKTYSFPDILREVKKITPSDLRRIAKGIFKSQASRLAVIGPFKKEEKRLYACIRDL